MGGKGLRWGVLGPGKIARLVTPADSLGNTRALVALDRAAREGRVVALKELGSSSAATSSGA